MGMNFDSIVPLPDGTDLGSYRIRGVRNAKGQIVRYLPEDIETAAAVYYLTGTLLKTGELLDVATSTISKWVDREEWINTITRLRRQHSDELDHKLSRIIDLAYDEVTERLINGDEVVTREGEKVRKRMSGRDAAWIGSVLFDKRQIGRKLPTAINDSVNADEKLNQIAQKMAEMAAAMPPPVRDITPAVDTHAPGAAHQEDIDMGRGINPNNGMRPIAPSQRDMPDFAEVHKPTPANAPLKEDLGATRYTPVEPQTPVAHRGEVMPFGNLADVDDLL